MARNRISGGGLLENTYGFSDQDQQERDASGARELMGLYEQSAQHRHQEQLQFYHDLHEQLEWSKYLSERSMHQAQAQRVMKYEAMMSHALPELYAINPADPKAGELRAQWAQKWPELLHAEKDIPSAVGQFEQHIRLGGEAERQRNEIQAKKESALERADERKSAQQEREDFMREMQKEREQSKAGPSDATKTKYQEAVRTAKDAQANLDKTQDYIDKANAYLKDNPTGTAYADLPQLEKSLNVWQSKLDKATATKEALETVHPDLSSNFKPDAAEPVPPPQTGAAAEEPVKTETPPPDPPPPPATPPAVSATATTSQPPAASNTDDQWAALTKQMQEAQAQADSHRQQRDQHENAIQKNTLFSDPFSTDLKQHIEQSNAHHNAAQEADAQWQKAYDARNALLQAKLAAVPASPPAAAVAPAPAVSTDASKTDRPPLDSIFQ